MDPLGEVVSRSQASRRDVLDVSVVIPAYNRGASVEKTLSSVLAAADALSRVDRPGATAPLAEIVLVDDGSTDDTAALADGIAEADPRVIVVRQGTNAGVSAARNAGARRATNELLVFLDCDDRVASDWLVELVSAMEDVDLAFCEGASFRPDGTFVGIWRPMPLGPVFAGVTGLFNPGMFIMRRDAFLAVGGYAIPLRFSENTELAIRLTRHLETIGRVTTRTIARPLVEIEVRETFGGSAAYTNESRFDSALYLVEVHRDRLQLDPTLLATYWAIAGVAAARLDRGTDAARCFLHAARVRPLDVRHLARAALALLAPARRRCWPARSGDQRT